MMDRQLGHMVRLIDDLLDVSRISRNKMELRRSRVLLADVVEQRRGDGPPRHRGGRARAHRLAPAGAGPPRRRPDPAGPGVQQPAHQQRQVHRAGRAHLARRRAARRRGGRVGAGHRDRHPRRRPCPASSTCSPRWTGASSGPPAASASGWRWSRAWSRCTAGRSRPRATARARAAPSPSGSRSLESRPRAAARGRRPGGRPAAAARGGASWWWTTTGTRPRSMAMMLKLAGQRGPHGPRRRRGGGGGGGVPARGRS